MKVSIVVPCKNEELHIARCVESLFALNFEESHEVIVVDGNSADTTPTLLAELQGSFPKLKVVVNPNGLTPVSMNMGINNAAGDYVMIASAHSEFDTNYLDVLYRELIRLDADVVGGVMKTRVRKESKKTTAILKILSHRMGVGGSKFRTGVEELTKVDTVPFGLYKKSLLDELNGYDERLIRNQDIELSKRILKKGKDIYLIPSVSCNYYARESYGGIAKNNFRNGYWNLLTVYITRNAESLSIRHFVPLGFILSLFVSLLIGLFCLSGIFMLFGILTLYLLLIITVSISLVDTSTSLFHLVWGFITLHFSYGLGSLAGLMRVDKIFH